jgi:hypothetical protein
MLSCGGWRLCVCLETRLHCTTVGHQGRINRAETVRAMDWVIYRLFLCMSSVALLLGGCDSIRHEKHRGGCCEWLGCLVYVLRWSVIEKA